MQPEHSAIEKGHTQFAPLLLLLLASALSASGADEMPVIQATSRVVDLIDGEIKKDGHWYIMPEKKPDTYYVDFPRKPHRVVFRTNKDSIAFDTTYGGVYDFVIRLKDQDVPTRIIARERNLLTYIRIAPEKAPAGPDSIPFTIGNNNKIYIKGRINDSPLLDFQFDLGCMGSIIKKGSVAKVKMNFDGSTRLINSDGANQVPTSSKNTLEIAGLRWTTNISFAVADNMTYREDGLLGNSLFQDKVLEIDYDRQLMIVRDSLPQIDTGYSRYPIKTESGVPFMQASIVTAQGTFTDWYMFDTGNSGSLRVPAESSKKYQLEDRCENIFNFKTRSIVLLPELRIANQSFSNVITVLQKKEGGRGLLGNAILKRFNVLLDNQNGFIYLKPNSLLNSRYDRSQLIVKRWYKPVLIVVLSTVGLVFFRKFRARRIQGDAARLAG